MTQEDLSRPESWIRQRIFVPGLDNFSGPDVR